MLRVTAKCRLQLLIADDNGGDIVGAKDFSDIVCRNFMLRIVAVLYSGPAAVRGYNIFGK